jgi:hypothetical protein
VRTALDAGHPDPRGERNGQVAQALPFPDEGDRYGKGGGGPGEGPEPGHPRVRARATAADLLRSPGTGQRVEPDPLIPS